MGPRRALEALTLTWLLTFLNPGLYSLSGYASLLRWLVIGVAFVNIAFQATFSTRKQGARAPRAYWWVVSFVIVAGVLSLFSSYMPDVSLFKLLSFLIATTAVLLGFHLTRDQVGYWKRWFLTFFTVVLFSGFPLVLHDLGYVRNQQGFQGLVNHPQAYAVFIAPFLSWIVALIVSRELKGFPWLFVTGIATISLLATQSRTGVLAAGMGLVSAIAWKGAQSIRVRYHLSRWLPRFLLALLIFGITLSLYGVDLQQSAVDFVMKRKGDQYEQVNVDVAVNSREHLIASSLANFWERPFMGIGFSMPSAPGYASVEHNFGRVGGHAGFSVPIPPEYFHASGFDVEREPFFGLPISAAVEKGFTLTAVLEEVGLIGFVFFVCMTFSLLRPSMRRYSGVGPAALALSAVMVNLGESVFFAMGATGLLMWLLIGAAYVLAESQGDAS
jgi:hypothetical protein